MSDSTVFELVGAVNTGGEESFIPFLVETFPRLTGEIDHSGSIIRQVQYRSADDEGSVHFLGVQVDSIRAIPERMVAWELREHSWVMLAPRDGLPEVVWEGALSWLWLDRSVPGRPIGEFTAECPSEWRAGGQNRLAMRVFANGYIGIPEAWEDDVQLHDYDPSWPARYEVMSSHLRDLLGEDIVLRIEHYGSTAIPGMSAKPVIDILVEVPSSDLARQYVVPKFNRPECEYWWYNDHICIIVRERAMGKRTHHLHIAPAGHGIWEGLLFRDHMRANPEDAERYAALKRSLAERYRTDREAYTGAKSEFVREIMSKAVGSS